MMKILVTGQIGAGKTTVAKRLAEGGLYVSADEIVKSLYESNPKLIRDIENVLDTNLRNSAGELDRNKLASIIFSDDEARLKVENLVHPLVEQKLQQVISESGSNLIVYENAVVRRLEQYVDFDVIVEVVTDEATRFKRLVAKGLSEIDAFSRIKVQSASYLSPAGAIQVVNQGSEQDLAKSVKQIKKELGLTND